MCIKVTNNITNRDEKTIFKSIHHTVHSYPPVPALENTHTIADIESKQKKSNQHEFCLF